jgi:hypothetical protein
LDKRIYKTEMKFWAVLGSKGCREKKPCNCRKYATFWGGFFNFLWAKKDSFFFLNILEFTLKSYIALWQRQVGKYFILGQNRLQTYFEISR